MTDAAETMQQQLARMKLAAGVRTDLALAKVLGVSQGAFSNARRRGKTPPKWFITIATAYDANLEWLMTGQGSPRATEGGPAPASWQPPVQVERKEEDNPWVNTRWQEVPLIGVGSCGPAGWFTPGPLALRVPMPVDYPYRHNMFAILAVGTSMQPEGIRQGNVVYCDPEAAIEPGDTVYVEKNDGTASIKRFLKKDDKRLHLQGWLDAKGDEPQKPYQEEVDLAIVTRISCVVVIKRKG